MPFAVAFVCSIDASSGCWTTDVVPCWLTGERMMASLIFKPQAGDEHYLLSSSMDKTSCLWDLRRRSVRLSASNLLWAHGRITSSVLLRKRSPVSVWKQDWSIPRENGELNVFS